MDGQLLSETFVELTDTMIADFDIIDFLHVLTTRSVELLNVSAAGLLLADPRGELRVVAASSEAARLLELFQLQSDQGPCLDCFRSGQPVTATDLSADKRWPRFADAAGQAGFAAVQALPMRLRDQVIGALNLFRGTVGDFDADSVSVGQALADVATISLLHERSMRRRRHPQRATADRAEQPGRHRAGQGQARRAAGHRRQPGVHPAARPGP